jgi:hypothetical protein
VNKKEENLCCGLPVPTPRHRRVALLRFANPLNGDSEITGSCAPELDPLVDVGLTFFTVDDSVEYPLGDDKPFPDDLPGPQAMRGSTWVVRERCRARCVHARIVDPGSLSLYAPWKKTVWLGVPVCEQLTRCQY